MVIKGLNITNFLTVGDYGFYVNLDSKGLVLISGDNKDDTSTISNGAGKSTIGDALCWCVYGITARGETGDDIINNINLKNTEVSTELLDDDGSTYAITRYRKHKTHKNSLHIVNTTTGKVLTKGTDKLTQDVVNKIIGCSMEVFTSSIYAGQDGIPNLPGMTDKNLKEIVETAAGVDRLLSAYEIAKDNLKVEKNNVEAIKKKVEGVEASIVKLESKKIELTKANDEFDITNAAEVVAKEAELLKEISGLGRLRNSPLLLTPEDVDDLRKVREEVVGAFNNFYDEQKKLIDIVNDLDKEFLVTETNLKSKALLYKNIKSEIENIEDRVGKPCGECGKEYCEEDLDGAVKNAKQSLAKIAPEINGLREKLVEIKAKKDSASDDVENLGDYKVISAETRKVVDEIDKNLSKSKDIEKEIATVNTLIKIKKEALHKQSSMTNPYESLLNSLLKELAEENDDLEKQRLNLAVAEDKVKLAEEGVQVFGPAGVRAYIIDTITPLLNERTAHYLSILTDGNISAVWNTLTKLKSGEIKERFSIEVENEKGAGKFGLLSGGEKRKVRIATTLALQDLVSSRAIKPINLFIADEIDDAIDDAGLERLMMLLDEKARERGTVLMISHNEIGSWCRNQAIVTKSGGFSKIDGALS